MALEQSAVVPCRTRDGQLEVLLITTTNGKRWVIPKGLVKPDLSPQQSALQEAYEEAGLLGDVPDREIGVYEFTKDKDSVHVHVFLMTVMMELESFPECGLRQRRWATAKEAAECVEDPGLREILKGVPEAFERLGRKPDPPAK